MAIIKSITDLQKYVNVVGTFDPATILPFVSDAQHKYLSRFLGEAFLQQLDEYVMAALLPSGDGWGGNPMITKARFENVLPYVQNALSAFSFFLASPSLDIKITDSGFAVINTGSLSPASAERVRTFKASMEQTGFDRVETLLRFLEERKDDYPSWKSSEAYTISMGSFLVSADQFDRIVFIDQSRLQFQRMRPAMQNIEMLRIEPVISTALADKIHAEIKANAFTDPVKTILPLICRAVAFLTAGSEIDPKFTGTGELFLSRVKLHLDSHPDLYPEYASSACYDAEKTSIAPYENQSDSSFFIFGS